MSGRDARLRVAAPDCLKALRAYLEEVVRQTGLEAEVELKESADIAFEGDDASASCRIAWSGGETLRDEFADPGEEAAGLPPDPRIEAYARTAGALAESPGLARTFLELLTKD